jgi:hypothetical protein
MTPKEEKTMSNISFYTLDEVLAYGSNMSTFKESTSDYPNLKDLPTFIIANYSDWFGLWTEETEEAKINAEKVTMTSRWTAWLKTKGLYLDDYISRQSKFSGETTSTNKFLDTPETATDYSGDTHITNITKTETQSDNQLGLDALRPFYEAIVHEFRKTWLLPKEAI